MHDAAKHLAQAAKDLDALLWAKGPKATQCFGVSVWQRRPGQATRQLLTCNQGYADLAGLDLAELLKHPHPDRLIKRLHNLQASMRRRRCEETGAPFRGLYSWLRPDGQENYVEYVAIPVHGKREIVLLCLDWDVTEKVRRAVKNEGGREVPQDSPFDPRKMMWSLFVDRSRWLNN